MNWNIEGENITFLVICKKNWAETIWNEGGKGGGIGDVVGYFLVAPSIKEKIYIILCQFTF